MTEDSNKRVIMQYLLGALSEPETERLDELSFTDDKFAESLQSAEHDLVDAYVQDELSATELERFNSYYLSTPLRQKKVAFARALQTLDRREAETPVPSPRSSERRRSWFFERLATPRFAWGLSTAVVVLLIVGGALLYQNIRLRRQIAETQSRREALLQREQELQAQLSSERTRTENELTHLREELARLEKERALPSPLPAQSSPVFSFVLRPPLRGVGSVPSFTVPAKTETVSIQLGLESTHASAYRVSLIDPSGQSFWRSNTLKLRPNERNLKVSFAANLLKPQTYVLQVMAFSENGTSEIVGDYPFRIVR
jgi:hypothetical protein